MKKYHKFVLNDKAYYWEFCENTGYYENLVTEKELLHHLLGNSLHSVIEIDDVLIKQALSTLPRFQKALIETYMSYLERVVESFEKTHGITTPKLTT